MQTIMSTTTQQYDEIVSRCKEVFTQKMADYGSSWRILRTSSLTDQLYIKAQRIRTIQETGENRVGESVGGEFQAMINYGIMALIQLDISPKEEPSMDIKAAILLYDKHATETRELMMKKNHDYGEAWRDMRVSSLTDLILTKLLRIKQIEDNDGKTLVSEGVDGNYHDIINYSVFALILLEG